MRRDWQAEAENWAVALLCARGIDDAYVPASVELRRCALHDLKTAKSDFDLRAADWGERHALELGRLERYRRGVNSVRNFLSLAADLVLCGDLDVGDLYSFLGPEVARHHYAVRVLIGSEAQRREPLMLDGVIPQRFDGQSERVTALTDLLCAEMAKRGDLDVHQLADMASHKQVSGSGLYCRRRLARLARHRNVVFSRFHRLRLQWHLMSAEYLSPRLLTLEYGHLAWAQPRAFQVFDWRSRLLKSYLKGLLSVQFVEVLTLAARKGRMILGIVHEAPNSKRRQQVLRNQLVMSEAVRCPRPVRRMF